jgi:hypothetical protein
LRPFLKRLCATAMFAAAILIPVTTSAVAGDVPLGPCPNGSTLGFRAYLPDCRSYELVSPSYKEGFTAAADGVSEEGTQVLGESFGSFSGTEDTGALGQSYKFMRTSTGWASTPLDAPYSEFSLYAVQTISPDFQSSLWSAHTPDQPLLEGIYRGPPEGALKLVGPGEPPNAGGEVLEFQGASDDLSHVLYTDRSPGGGEVNHLWPGDTTAGGRLPSLYEYEGLGNSEPRLVGITNIGMPASVPTAHLISDCGTYLGSFPEGNTYNAVSASGATVFFTASASSVCHAFGPSVNEIYARLGASRTVSISEPSTIACTECQTTNRMDAQFRGASLSGSTVLFTTEQPLLPDAIGVGPYLYRYDFEAAEGKRVTLVSAGDGTAGRVLGVVRVSEDGSHVYFVSQARLTGANKEGEAPIDGAPNLYVWTTKCAGPASGCEEIGSEHMAFVTTLSSADESDWTLQESHPAQATPGGRYLVFQSVANLTPDQNGRQEAGQVFEYDSQTETLVRVSQGQGGFNENGHSARYRATIPIQGYERDPHIQRSTHLAVSADGSRVFFSSEDALTPQALEGVNNIYEYHDGRVGLISDGHDVALTTGSPAVELIGTDGSGQDVFFTTTDQLVPQDTDTLADIYDARINGGFVPSPTLAQCAADSCQGPTSGLPLPPATAPAIGEAPPGPDVVGAKQKPAAPKRKTVRGKKKSRHRTRAHAQPKHRHGKKTVRHR